MWYVGVSWLLCSSRWVVVNEMVVSSSGNVLEMVVVSLV